MCSRRSSLILCLLLSTWALLFSPAASLSRDNPSAIERLPDAAVDTMLRYRHVRETHGYNRSPEIDGFARDAGAALGSSWCEEFRVAAFMRAARALGIKSPLLRTASVSQQLRYASMVGSGLQVIPISRVIGSSSIRLQRGDLLMAKHKGGRDRDIGRLWPGHAGTTIEQRGSRVISIEGNTSSGQRGSQRDGDGVFIRDRALTFWLAAVRIPKPRVATVWPVRLRYLPRQT